VSCYPAVAIISSLRSFNRLCRVIVRNIKHHAGGSDADPCATSARIFEECSTKPVETSGILKVVVIAVRNCSKLCGIVPGPLTVTRLSAEFGIAVEFLSRTRHCGPYATMLHRNRGMFEAEELGSKENDEPERVWCKNHCCLIMF